MYASKQFVLRRIVSTNTNMRTDEAIGYFICPPSEGTSFVMISDALDPSLGDTSFRHIVTSEVKSVENIDGGWKFKTKNSVYTLKERKSS